MSGFLLLSCILVVFFCVDVSKQDVRSVIETPDIAAKVYDKLFHRAKRSVPGSKDLDDLRVDAAADLVKSPASSEDDPKTDADIPITKPNGTNEAPEEKIIDCTEDVLRDAKLILGTPFNIPKNDNESRLASIKNAIEQYDCKKTGARSAVNNLTDTYSSTYCIDSKNGNANVTQLAVKKWLESTYKYPGEAANVSGKSVCEAENKIRHNMFLRLAGKNTKNILCAKTKENTIVRCVFEPTTAISELEITSELFDDELYCKYMNGSDFPGLGLCEANNNTTPDCDSLAQFLKNYQLRGNPDVFFSLGITFVVTSLVKVIF